MKNMTPEKGRKLLEESGVIIFPSFNFSSALVFDRILHNKDGKHKLSPKGVTKVYTR